MGEHLEDAHIWPRWENQSPRPVIFQGSPGGQTTVSLSRASASLSISKAISSLTHPQIPYKPFSPGESDLGSPQSCLRKTELSPDRGGPAGHCEIFISPATFSVTLAISVQQA